MGAPEHCDENLTVVEVTAGRVSDIHMASRKAEEAASRRFLAAGFLQKVVGAKLPAEPSEEQLRLCLRNGALLCRLVNRIEPGVVNKVVETSSSDGSLSAFQCFENLRNFLVAAQELRVPTFEISDLEQVTGPMSKVVDCLLALKSYKEWKQTGALGSWKYAGSLKSPLRGNTYPRGHGKKADCNGLQAADNARKRLLVLQSDGEAQQPLREEPKGLVGHRGQTLEFVAHATSEIQNLRVALKDAKAEAATLKSRCLNEFQRFETQVLDIAASAQAYHKVLTENRKLYNEVQDLKGNIRVYCRVRPSDDMANPGTVEFIGNDGEIIIHNRNKPTKDSLRTFKFNKAFGPTATQESVYDDTQPLIRSVLDGYNVCIFAYGQTGSGKTYTMTGPDKLTEETLGVNYRALNDLFSLSRKRKELFQYAISVQMIEIYNENLRDLLASDTSNKKLEIRNSSQKNGVNVPDATMMRVNSTSDVVDLMRLGHKNRSVGSTAMNERSSRSHSVLTVHVTGTDLTNGALLHGSLHLIDLAGSERIDKSEATGERLKEAQFINKSLAALGDVIYSLSTKSSHVPYRNSKLTQLLQDSLGGQAKTLMFVHVSPDNESYGETMSTLKFAERVATVELGAARSNRESGDIRDLKEQIAALKESITRKDAEIERLKLVRSSSNETTCSGDSSLRIRAPSCRRSPEDMFESCLSSDNWKTDQNWEDTDSSDRENRVGRNQRVPTKRSTDYGKSPASVRKSHSGALWRTPLQPQKQKPSDPRLTHGDKSTTSRRYSTVGLPPDCSSVKRPSTTRVAKDLSRGQAGDGVKPTLARHLFAVSNGTTKPTKS